MGFIDKKQDVINSVSTYEIMGDLPKSKVTSSLDSVKSKKFNLLPYLMDVLSSTCKDNSKNSTNTNVSTSGSTFYNKSKCESSRILTEILVRFYPELIIILKQGIIQGIKAGLACGTDFNIPSPPPKFKVKITSIDFNGSLKIDPTSEVGSIYYGTSASEDFNWFLYDLVQNGGLQSWYNIVDISYDKNSQEFEMSVNQSYAGKPFDKFLMDYINSINLISLESLIPKITNLLTGVLNANIPDVNSSVDKLLAMEKVNSLQSKIHDSDPCKEDYQYKDNYYTFTNDELSDMEELANQKMIGVTNLDLGCGIIPVTVDINTIKKAYGDLKNANPNKATLIMSQSLDSVNNDLTRNVPEKDKNVAKLSLALKMIEELPKIFTNIVLEPKIVSLYQISLKTVNDIVLNVTNSFDYAKSTSVFFEYVARESLAALLKVIYSQVKKEILDLVEKTAMKIAKERVKYKVKLINNLVSSRVNGALESLTEQAISTGVDTLRTASNNL